MEHVPQQCPNPDCEGTCVGCLRAHYLCGVCNGYDGSVLPSCPGRRLTAHEKELIASGKVASVEQLDALETVDFAESAGRARNMYGCLPCPKCKSVYRASYGRAAGLTIECDDCGHKALARNITEAP